MSYTPVSIEPRANDGFAVCDRDGVKIQWPRVLPSRTENEAEFEFPVLIGEARTSVGFLSQIRSPTGGAPASTEIRLNSAPALRQILRIREQIGSALGMREYVDTFVHGLRAVFADGCNLWEGTEFSVTVAPETLFDTAGGSRDGRVACYRARVDRDAFGQRQGGVASA